ncbi:MAG: hypothetical protein GY913_29445 [Proteobacteria bacterium]|nr:hypothetical protein [Pseudomonadota bacterium]MCP4921041.1 hypothetical protein [Pseudomonadota bacterium]
MKWVGWGAFLGALPGLLFGAWAVWHNPWFLDEPTLFLVVAIGFPAGLGGALGLLRPTEGRPVGAVFVLLGVLALFFRPVPEVESPDVLVIGIDGATWTVIDDLELPHLQGVRERGASGTLTSMEPMFSPLLWTTMASGRIPAEHGIHGFHVHADDADVPRFWDVAEAEGRSIGIYKWLVTYPPREVDGFIVPAWLAPSPETFPAELSFVKELELANRMKRKQVETRRPGWQLALTGIPQGLRMSTLTEVLRWKIRERDRPDDDERFIALNLLRGKLDRDVFVHALYTHEPELATFTYYATDGLGHRFWDRLGSEDDPLSTAYRQADGIVGELLSYTDEDTTVLIVSDHGFQALDADKLFVAPKTERLMERLGERLGRVQVSRLGIKLTVTAEEASLEALEDELALLTVDGVPLYAWTPIPDSPATLGLTLTNEQVTAEELAGSTDDGEPLADYASLSDRSYTGDHHPDGVVLALGPDVTPGRLDGGLLDVAPTVHTALGIAPAEDLPGRSLFGEAGTGPVSRDALVHDLVWGEGAAGVDEDALRALGYME